MIAVDTNVLVRWVTRDDRHQAALADTILAKPIYVSHTVLLELAWVLGGKTYAFSRAMQVAALRTLLELATVVVPDEAGVGWAIDRLAAGADFADMLHLLNANGASVFLSFEGKLAAKAGSATPVPIERVS